MATYRLILLTKFSSKELQMASEDQEGLELSFYECDNAVVRHLTWRNDGHAVHVDAGTVNCAVNMFITVEARR